MKYADGIATYVKHGDVIMPFGYHSCPLDFQRLLFSNYAKIFPINISSDVKYTDISIENKWGYRHYENILSKQPVSKLILYFHGGGFVLGGYDSHHDIAAEFCQKTGHDIWLINYPLSPECPFPIALDFCAEIYQIAAKNTKYDSIMVAGDSSGGNLAVNIAILSIKSNLHEIEKLSLFSPVLNFARWSSGGEDAPRLSGDEMEYFVKCYTADVISADDIRISPILHEECFDIFPKTLLISAGEDSLKEDSYLLEEKLKNGGNNVEHICFDGLVHGCIRAKNISQVAANAFRKFWQYLS